MAKRKKTMKGGAVVPTLTKQEVLADPQIKQALKAYASQGGSKMRQMGAGWWDDFVNWLKDNKVISIASKIGSAIANATGFVPLGVALGGVATASSALGYGKMKGRGIDEDAQAVARGIVGRQAMRITRPRPMMRGGEAQLIAYPSSSTNSEVAFLKW